MLLDENGEEIEFVYHGSPNGNIKEFIPRESTQKGAYVYATKYLELALIFGFRMSSFERSLGYRNNKFVVVERFKDFLKQNDMPVYIYKFSAKDFEYFNKDNFGNHEVRTSKFVKPVEVIRFDSAFEALKQFSIQGKIDLYLYPNKPHFIPQNDYDLIQNALKVYAMNPTKNKGTLNRLKNLVPKFENVVEYLKQKLSIMTEEQIRNFADKCYIKGQLCDELKLLVCEAEESEIEK